MVGCNCYGCCFDALPPPPLPPFLPPPWPLPQPQPAIHLTPTGATALCGEITSDARLPAGSYELTCPLVVRAGATLTVEAGCSFHASGGWPAANFSSIDTDADGRVTSEELWASHMWNNSGDQAIRLFRELVRALDVDSSGDLDSAEWADPGLAVTNPGASAMLLGIALVMERGGRLVASGRTDAPITFDFAGTGSGLVILGGAPTAHEVQRPYPYGGDEWADSSGVLRYVRVWHSRRGIGLFGVGNGTDIEHCEVAYSASNGFELHGGAVDVHHLSALFANGSAIALGGGYAGRGQYVFAALGADGLAGLTITGAATRPQLWSVTILGGGLQGLPSSSLAHLGGGGGEIGDAMFLHSPGVGIELAGPPTCFAQRRPSPPPVPPPPSPIATELLHASRQCGLQHEDGLSEGIGLGEHPSAESCAWAAGQQRLTDGGCESFQFSAVHPLWGCICCVQADGGPASNEWAVYRLTTMPPPLPSIPRRGMMLPSSPPPPPLLFRPSAECEVHTSRQLACS